MSISNIIGPLMDRTTYEVFSAYRDILLRRPITYIVPAVWGAIKEGELDLTQKEIHQKMAPIVGEVLTSFQSDTLSVSQEFALQYLVRGYIISRIIYMIEASRCGAAEGITVDKQAAQILN